MPYKEIICGVYSITTPSGSIYVGSSHNIKRRWCEHRSTLRSRKHRSTRLQAAWDKYNGELDFKILEVCPPDHIEEREQFYINMLGAKLNTTPYVGNVWCNPETREKFKKIHGSEEWKKARSEIALRVAKRRGVKVDCSDGRSFDNFHRAAEAFGVSPSRIKYMSVTQRSGNLGVKFKRATDEWREALTAPQQRLQTMIANGTLSREKKNRKCSLDGCDKKHKGHGLCDAHLRQKRKQQGAFK